MPPCEHAALYHPGGGFRGGEGETLSFVQTNVLGTLQLIEAALAADVGRFVFHIDRIGYQA